jgi:hypothetical protein
VLGQISVAVIAQRGNDQGIGWCRQTTDHSYASDGLFHGFPGDARYDKRTIPDLICRRANGQSLLLKGQVLEFAGCPHNKDAVYATVNDVIRQGTKALFIDTPIGRKRGHKRNDYPVQFLAKVCHTPTFFFYHPLNSSFLWYGLCALMKLVQLPEIDVWQASEPEGCSSLGCQTL